MSPTRLVEVLRQLATVRVRWTNWDDFIEGRLTSLTGDVLTAREVAARELRRWQGGRFKALHVAIADAVFSKQKKYRTAVTTHIRPFAAAWGSFAFDAFCRHEWATVFEGTFGRAPREPLAPTHNHLSSEGRVRTILSACRKMLGLGLLSAEQASARAQDELGRARMEAELFATSGLGEALTANILMNLGHLRPKLDTHVRAVVSESCGIPKDASAAEMLHRLEAAGAELGMHPFELDQIIWYARAEAA
jgi:hypothetical protein